MKNKIASLTVIFTLALCIVGTTAFSHATADSIIEVCFSNKMRFNDLVKIKMDLAEKAIVLKYEMLEFDKAGKLKKISYEVNAGKFGGADKSNNLTEEIGFIINEAHQRKYDIIVGTKKQIEARKAQLENSGY